MTDFIILASGADHGTRSISSSFIFAICPNKKLIFKKGFKKMGFTGWWSGLRFIKSLNSSKQTLLCLFNAPILLAAIFRCFFSGRIVGVLDWTESYPSLKKNLSTGIYDWFYLWAFRRLDAVYSPSPGFRKYYNMRGANIRPGLYPIPIVLERRVTDCISTPIRVLYIGADCKRKGGDILLKQWSEQAPEDATLTFVSPTPPINSLQGVSFLKDITSGTEEHKMLFASHDVFVLPTNMEPFGYSLLEAITAGLCVVTTMAAGASELVAKSGGVVEACPSDALESLFTLIRNPVDLSRRMEICRHFKIKYQKEFLKFIEEL